MPVCRVCPGRPAGNGHRAEYHISNCQGSYCTGLKSGESAGRFSALPGHQNFAQ